jgi:hypothetical protein
MKQQTKDVYAEKGQLLEIHLLEKTARHQNLDCSTPKSRLLDTVRADNKSISICSKIKKVCRTCLVEHMHFLDQNVQLLELHLLDKRLKNCQLLDNIFSKEMVYRYGR